jgi:hypothetical protein
MVATVAEDVPIAALPARPTLLFDISARVVNKPLRSLLRRPSNPHFRR